MFQKKMQSIRKHIINRDVLIFLILFMAITLIYYYSSTGYDFTVQTNDDYSLMLTRKNDNNVKSSIVISKESSAYYNETYNIYHEQEHSSIVYKFMKRREAWTTSNLGAILFLDHDPGEYVKEKNKNKIFTVLIWRYYNWLQNRHLKSFGKDIRDPLSDCHVKNCLFTGDDTAISTADAVVVHLQRGEVPPLTNRTEKQRWIFLTDESPLHTFTLSKNKDWTRYVDVFNWSMTYRSDADIPVPYGRVLPLELPKISKTSTRTDLIPNWKQKRRDVLVAVLVSNCIKFRMDYIRSLSQFVEVHVYGQCSKNFKNSCPGHFKADCKPIENYLFYLDFENSKCRQYLTEKGFHNAYSKGSIPIIMGPTIDDCETLLPPSSFLHVDSYSTPKDLADDILSISRHEERLLAYHDWRIHFQLFNEHGYFKTGSHHYCRVCEGLNYNDEKPKIYDLKYLEWYLDPKKLCH